MQKKLSNYKKYNTNNPVKKMLIENFKKKFVSMVDLADGDRLCDLGCGEGFIVNYVLKQSPNVYVEGYDIEEAAISIARKINPDVKFGTIDVRNISVLLKRRRFDYVLLMEVLEHIPDYERVLEQLSEMNFSRLVISVPNEPLFSVGNLVFGKNVVRFGKDIDHVNFFSERMFKSILGRYFNVVDFASPFPWLISVCEKW